MASNMTMRILFVCLGNICRSPMAEGLFRKEAEQRGLLGAVEIDSAGTIDWHSGRAPDPRACSTVATLGIDISGKRSRPCTQIDLDRFDLILSVDGSNLEHLLDMATEEQRTKIGLLLDYSTNPSQRGRDVPDPFYEGAESFDHALALMSDAVNGLCDHVARLNGKASSST